jgi:hypothetical protein
MDIKLPIKEIRLSIFIVISIVLLQSVNSYGNVFAQPSRCANTILCNQKLPANSQFHTPITVKFLSIHVIDDHEGLFHGNGEIFLQAQVNGKGIQLLNSYEGLGDNSNYNFNNKVVQVNVPPGNSLVITTTGCESDVDQTKGCLPGDDKIGTVSRTYYGPGFGAGGPGPNYPQMSTLHDFELSYVICNAFSKVDSPYC